MKFNGFKNTGNAIDTIYYTANGEASDWMLHDKNIISISPELGLSDFKNDFFPSPSFTKMILSDNYRAIEIFL